MRDNEQKNRNYGSDTNQNYQKITGNCHKLDSYNWLKDIPEVVKTKNIVEVRFKNTRKDFFRNVNELRLKTGDIVAVEASPGHDIGIVALTGELAYYQMIKNNGEKDLEELKKVYRKAKPADLEKWEEAISLEKSTMLKSRKIADDLKLEMKIGDVEYQGDNTKAIFYYIADGRVDFRELIKILADNFKVRIEMRQIGARQETGRIGGTGPCGRELCCSSWMSNFISVTTNSARHQELSLNPQKLSGQCGKLKCCLNYELDSYLDAKKDFPDTSIPLETEEGTAYHQKTDIFKRLMWYSFDKENTVNLSVISVDRVIDIQEKNKMGQKVQFLEDKTKLADTFEEFKSDDGEESLDRFNNSSKSGRKRSKRKKIKRRSGNEK
jgi:cell fate regulator YaaT (PSP1 superfamily)